MFETEGSQGGEVVAPFPQQAGQGEAQSQDRDGDADEFEGVGDGEGLPEDAQGLAAEMGLGVNSQSWVTIFPTGPNGRGLVRVSKLGDDAGG